MSLSHAPAGRAALEMSSIDAMRSEANTSLRGRAAAVGPFFAPDILCSWTLHRKTKHSWGALGLGRPRTRSKLFRGVVGSGPVSISSRHSVFGVYLVSNSHADIFTSNHLFLKCKSGTTFQYCTITHGQGPTPPPPWAGKMYTAPSYTLGASARYRQIGLCPIGRK